MLIILFNSSKLSAEVKTYIGIIWSKQEKQSDIVVDSHLNRIQKKELLENIRKENYCYGRGDFEGEKRHTKLANKIQNVPLQLPMNTQKIRIYSSPQNFQLESKPTLELFDPKEKKKSYVLVDSHLNRIRKIKFKDNLPNARVFVKSFSGTNTNQLNNYAVPVMVNGKSNNVVIHIGSNNIMKFNYNNVNIEELIHRIITESAKLRALLTKNLFTCQSALYACLLTCQSALHAYVLTCLTC